MANVPNIGPRARYQIVGNRAAWIYQRMATGVALNGAAPRTTLLAAADLDPVVTGGRAEYTGLSQGGLFKLLGDRKWPLVIEALDNTAVATFSIVDSTGAALRAIPGTTPFKLAAGEYLKATGGTTGSYVGVLARVYTPEGL